MSEVEVKFQPEGRTIRLQRGSMLSRAVTKAGVPMDFPCGGQGNCGKCRVSVLSDAPEPSPADRLSLTPQELEEGLRLACQTRVTGPMTVEVPESSLLADNGQILATADAAADCPAPGDPPVVKRYVRLEQPTLEDDRPDLERLRDHVGSSTADLDLVRELPGRLRAQDFSGTAVLAENHLLDFEAGDTASECYTVSFDIGTTTLVGVLVNLTTGREAASESRINPQTRFGDDVLSRIQEVRDEENGLVELHTTLRDAINEMLDELCSEAQVPVERVYEATFAGNTTMLHLLAGISPAALGEVPFVPVLRRSETFSAARLGLRIHPRGLAVVFPVIGGFVGGDTVAGILVTGLAEATEPTLLVDIGTNGEIVVNHDGRLLAASCAAGPAFEGATITHGMRATTGAIEEIVIEDDVRVRVIGGARPTGLCGSALIDVSAELLRNGILSPQGMMLAGDDLPDDLPPKVRARVVDGEDGPEFVVVRAKQSGTGSAVTVTHRDFRALQLATGAIRAGISVLVKQIGLTPADLARVCVAGAFGNYIRPHNAQRMGLLPHQVDPSRIDFVGNTSLAGAKRVAMSRRARRRANELALHTEHVELSRDPNFQMEYMEAMFFPTEEAAAPSG